MVSPLTVFYEHMYFSDVPIRSASVGRSLVSDVTSKLNSPFFHFIFSKGSSDYGHPVLFLVVSVSSLASVFNLDWILDILHRLPRSFHFSDSSDPLDVSLSFSLLLSSYFKGRSRIIFVFTRY